MTPAQPVEPRENSCWRLAGHHAQCELAGWCAELDCVRPELGLAWRRSNAVMAADAPRYLGVELGTTPEAAHVAAHVRSGDLVAIYEESPDWPRRAIVYWRQGPALPGACVLDVHVSVQTSLFDDSGELHLTSRMPADRAWRLRTDGQWTELTLPPNGVLEFAAGDASPGMAFEMRGGAYVELVHPADFCGATLTFDGATWTLRQRLFTGALEKGVILRGRLRGVWTDDPSWQATARAVYDDLLRAPLPLTA